MEFCTLTRISLKKRRSKGNSFKNIITSTIFVQCILSNEEAICKSRKVLLKIPFDVVTQTFLRFQKGFAPALKRILHCIHIEQLQFILNSHCSVAISMATSTTNFSIKEKQTGKSKAQLWNSLTQHYWFECWIWTRHLNLRSHWMNHGKFWFMMIIAEILFLLCWELATFESKVLHCTCK